MNLLVSRPPQIQPLRNLEVVNAVKIINEINTQGSAPLRILGEDGVVYIAKTTLQRNPPAELINEVLCGYFCECWDLKVPKFNLISISNEVLQDFLTDGRTLSQHYGRNFNNTLLFGSSEISPVVELDRYIEIKTKWDLKKFSKPLDLLKIGTLDLWVGNMDRKPNNPNILMSSQHSGFDLHPIDHAAAFGYLTNYKEVRSALVRITPANCILSSSIAKKMKNLVADEDLIVLRSELSDNINNTIENLDFVFGQIPPEWGFGAKSKDHLKSFFSDNQRNQETLINFLSF